MIYVFFSFFGGCVEMQLFQLILQVFHVSWILAEVLVYVVIGCWLQAQSQLP